DEPYPMGDVVRTLAPRFIDSPDDFARSYPLLCTHAREGMDTTGRAAARDAAGRETVNAFRAHHFAGLGCRRPAGHGR
ncbi:hypothetical protein ABZT43_51135, partial [Streptomyces sp. NPDC005349]|uniref:hypothetical protein n=1 Tax=Streptomyces sp. NPDC005349 TaxID=3157037 RepID=UPI0033A81C4F